MHDIVTMRRYSGASSGVEDGAPVRGGKRGRREVWTGVEAPTFGALVGVLPSDAGALGHWSWDGVSGVVLTLLDAALNACSSPPWLEVG